MITFPMVLALCGSIVCVGVTYENWRLDNFRIWARPRNPFK